MKILISHIHTSTELVSFYAIFFVIIYFDLELKGGRKKRGRPTAHTFTTYKTHYQIGDDKNDYHQLNNDRM